MTSFEVYFLTSRTVNEDFFVSCSCMVQNIIIPLVIFQLNSDICDKILIIYALCEIYQPNANHNWHCYLFSNLIFVFGHKLWTQFPHEFIRRNNYNAESSLKINFSYQAASLNFYSLAVPHTMVCTESMYQSWAIYTDKPRFLLGLY